jgi:D-alanyl-lipoteichoic acid acyltransferase DltB (MBOAT superfamily)
LATLGFSIQLYCDFSGYSDIAVGSSQIFGIKLTENFKRPYFSKSVSEFWKRWHISLSSWFQDYVFVPLYIRVSKIKKLSRLNTKNKHIVSFIVSIIIGETLLGLWHGANWTFVLFGFYFGVVISGYYLGRKHWDAMNKYLQILFTFILVNLSWIIFRSNSVSEVIYILNTIITLDNSLQPGTMGFGPIDWLLIFFPLIIVFFVDVVQEKKQQDLGGILKNIPGWIRKSIYLILIIWIITFGVFNPVQFIYAKF